MIELEKIQNLVGNHVSPYIYNSKEFIPVMLLVVMLLLLMIWLIP